MKLLCVVAILGLFTVGNGNVTRVRTVDATGEPFAKVLIVVKSLEGGGEIARFLTDSEGRTPSVQLGNGLYRVIAICPYGICQTKVVEFLGSSSPPEISVTVSVNPTDLNGEVIGGTRVHLVVEGLEGRASGAHILVRDTDARWERWYVADTTGSADVELQSDPAVIVVTYNGIVFTQEVSTHLFAETPATTPGRAKRTSLLQTITLRLGRKIEP